MAPGRCGNGYACRARSHSGIADADREQQSVARVPHFRGPAVSGFRGEGSSPNTFVVTPVFGICLAQPAVTFLAAPACDPLRRLRANSLNPRQMSKQSGGGPIYRMSAIAAASASWGWGRAAPFPGLPWPLPQTPELSRAKPPTASDGRQRETHRHSVVAAIAVTD